MSTETPKLLLKIDGIGICYKSLKQNVGIYFVFCLPTDFMLI